MTTMAERARTRVRLSCRLGVDVRACPSTVAQPRLDKGMFADPSLSIDTNEAPPSPSSTPEPASLAAAPTVSTDPASVRTRLPMEVLLRVVENACATDEFVNEHGLDPEGESDSRMR